MTGFNLLTDNWIPFDGRDVSIRDALLRAHELPGWPTGPPGLAAAVLRTLAVFTYRITGMDQPMTPSQFAAKQRRLLDTGRFDPADVDAYTNSVKDRFWLTDPPDGETLFGQDPTLAAVDAHEAAKAVTIWASGHNPMLGPHQPTGTLPHDLAAQQLIVLRYYAAGGRHTQHPLHRGQGRFEAGSLRGTMSLHPRTSTLARTLIGHLAPADAAADGSAAFGAPFWESPPPANPVAAHRGPAGLLEQLAARHDKTMLLRTDDAGSIVGFTIAEGPGRNPDLDCGDLYALAGPDQMPVKPRLGRAFWREAEALLTQADSGGPALSAPVLAWARGEHAPAQDVYSPGAFSWTVVSHLGNQSKDLLWYLSDAPDLLTLFEPQAARRALGFLNAACDAESVMATQIAKVHHDVQTMPTRPNDRAAVYAAARAELYRRAEPDFWAAAHGALTTDEQIKQLRRHALAGFDVATSALVRDRRTLVAVEQSRRWLAAWPRARRDAPTPPEAQ